MCRSQKPKIFILNIFNGLELIKLSRRTAVWESSDKRGPGVWASVGIPGGVDSLAEDAALLSGISAPNPNSRQRKYSRYAKHQFAEHRAGSQRIRAAERLFSTGKNRFAKRSQKGGF
jgi:hypothetical protein